MAKLEVKHLTISFRTNNGAVRAVRDVSFELNEGETLAIAGESGSGKSVTTRAVMGILAGNAMVDNGEIIYDARSQAVHGVPRPAVRAEPHHEDRQAADRGHDAQQ